MNTCTVVTGAAGELCGEEAVTAFDGRDGVRYYECSKHEAPGTKPRTDQLRVGDKVHVVHCGAPKVGVVVSVRKTLADVRVGIRGGKDTKVIQRAIENLEVV